jgi:hypothetical protein
MSNGYVVYVDESGDHSLTKINPDYPMFVLAFCIFPIDIYVDRVVPLVQQIKFDFCNHDMVVLHEREIRQATPPFDPPDRPGVERRSGFPGPLGLSVSLPVQPQSRMNCFDAFAFTSPTATCRW